MALPKFIQVNAMGVGTHHAKGYMHARKGCGDFLFLHFITPYRIHLGGGVLFREAGDCILYSPDTHQRYGSNGLLPYGNDWLHISGPSVRQLLDHLEIPLDTIFSPRSSAFIHKELQAIMQERAQCNPNWELAVDLRVKSLFLELSRALREGDAPRLSRRNEEMHDSLTRLRLEMRARCTEKWDIARMLDKVHMSRSRFLNLYAASFGVAPVRDLIAMRLELAKSYLASSDMSVAQIAAACGFSDIYYFCRQFKQKHGLSAGAYRKQNAPP